MVLGDVTVLDVPPPRLSDKTPIIPANTGVTAMEAVKQTGSDRNRLNTASVKISLSTQVVELVAMFSFDACRLVLRSSVHDLASWGASGVGRGSEFSPMF